MSALGISIREFARRDGCSDTLVRKAIKSGHLSAFDDGSLDPDHVGGDWRKTNRRGANPDANQGANVVAESANRTEEFAPTASDDESAAEVAERIISSSGAPFSLIEAERTKENYLALLKQLEYDIKSGAVVAVEDIARAVGEEYAKVRTRLLAIPAEQAPRLHRLKTVAEVQDVLMGCVVEALEELVRDRAAG